MNGSNSKEEPWQYWDDLPKNEEDRLIEEMARFFVKRRLGLLAQMFLESVSPISRIGSELGLGLFGPYLEFFGAAKIAAVFRKRRNVERLINRIDELEKEEKG